MYHLIFQRKHELNAVKLMGRFINLEPNTT